VLKDLVDDQFSMVVKFKVANDKVNEKLVAAATPRMHRISLKV
jgi:hypothetical protein